MISNFCSNISTSKISAWWYLIFVIPNSEVLREAYAKLARLKSIAVTLEFSNTTPLPAKIYANEGVAQFIFLKGNEKPEVTYADRKGKYMGQTGVTLPKV